MIFTVLAACLLLVAPLSSGAPMAPRGLDSNIEYVYQYVGNVTGGLGEVGGYRDEPYGGRAMVSLGLKAIVKIQRTGLNIMAIKLSNIQVNAQKSRDVNCHGLCGSSDWQPMPSPQAEQLEKPYLYNTVLSDHENWVLEVPTGEEPWVTNIRKSIVQSYDQHLPKMISELEDQLCEDTQNATRPEYTTARRKQTHTLYGHCDTLYNIERVRVVPKYVKESLINDIQSPMTQGRKLPSGHVIGPMDYNATFRIIKTIEFDTCQTQNMPKLVRSSSGNYTNYGRPNTTLDSLNRHVQSIIHVRGSLCGLHRVESTETKGSVSYNPFDVKTQRLQSVTNMTMILTHVNSRLTPFRFSQPYTRVHHLFYEALSPYSGPGIATRNNQWMRYNSSLGARFNQSIPKTAFLEKVLLGNYSVQVDVPQTIELVKNLIRSSFQLLERPNQVHEVSKKESPVNILKSTSSGEAAIKLHAAQRGVSALEKQDIEKLYQQVSRESGSKVEKSLLIDVMAASTSGPAVQALLEKMNPKSSHYDSYISMTKKAAVMLALSDNIPDPVVVPYLINFLKTVDVEQHKIAGPVILAAGSKVLNKLCSVYREDKFAYPTELYGAEECNIHDLKVNYIQYLEQHMLQNTSQQYQWQERVSHLQAYITLGIDVQIDRLQHIAKYDTEKIMRTTAIYGMSRKYLPMNKRVPAIKVLLSNVRNYALASELRQASLAALVSWQPSQDIWNELGEISMQPNAFNIATYIVSLMETVAASSPSENKQAVYAANALRLAKPTSTTVDWSHFTGYSFNDTRYKTGIRYEQGWIMKNGTSYPDQTYYKLSGSAGRLDYSFVELVQQFSGYNMTFFPPYSYMPRPVHRNQPADPKYKLQMKLLETDIFMPMYFKDMNINPSTGSPLLELIWNTVGPCQQNKEEGLILQYYNPQVKEIFFPTEIGLPVVKKFVTPTVLYAKLTERSGSCSHATGRFQAKYDVKFTTKATSLLEVFSPWQQKKIVAGVDSEKTVTIPVLVQGKFNRTGSVPTSKSPSQWMRGQTESKDASCPIRGDFDECHGFEYSVRSLQQQRIPVFFTQVTPFTGLKPLQPGKEVTGSTQLVVIRDYAQTIRQFLPLFPDTQVNTTLAFEGDRPSPLNWVTVMEVVQNPSKVFVLLTIPSGMYARTILYVDPETSRNQEATFRTFYEYYLSTSDEVKEKAPKQSIGAFIMSGAVKFSESNRYSLIWHATKEQKEVQGQDFINNIHQIKTNKGPAADVTNFNDFQDQFIGNLQGPKVASLKELRGLLLQGRPGFLNTTLQLKWHSNENQNTRAPVKDTLISQLNGKIGLSKQRSDYIINEVQKVGYRDGEEPEVALNQRTLYDQIYLHQRWERPLQSLSRAWQTLFLRIKQISYGFLFPKMVPIMPDHNKTQDVVVRMNRTMNNIWRGSCYDCFPAWTLHDLQSCPAFDIEYLALVEGRRQISFSSDIGTESMRPLGPYPPYRHLKSEAAQGHRVCTSQNGVMKTFDDVTYSKLANKGCFQLMTSDCSASSERQWFVYSKAPFTTSQSAQKIQVLRYIDQATDVVVGGDGLLMINGHKISRPKNLVEHKSINVFSKEGAKVGRCDYIPSLKAYQCIIFQKVILQPMRTEARVILIGEQEKNRQMCGMCGNNNRDKVDDTMGNKCRDYQDMSLMAASYTSEQQCQEQPQLNEQIQRVKSFEQSQRCTTVQERRPWGQKLPSLPQIELPSDALPEPKMSTLESQVNRMARPRQSHQEAVETSRYMERQREQADLF